MFLRKWVGFRWYPTAFSDEILTAGGDETTGATPRLPDSPQFMLLFIRV
eukprot:COSAG02_NODE_66125_length_256_cov_0.662420_1_plen_48_part_01